MLKTMPNNVSPTMCRYLRRVTLSKAPTLPAYSVSGREPFDEKSSAGARWVPIRYAGPMRAIGRLLISMPAIRHLFCYGTYAMRVSTSKDSKQLGAVCVQSVKHQ